MEHELEHEPEGTTSRKADIQDCDLITMSGQADLLADCQPKRKRRVKTKSTTGKRPATQPKPSGLDQHDVVGSVMSHMDSTFGPPTPQMCGSVISFPAPTQRIPFLVPDDDSAPCSSSRSGMSDEVSSEDISSSASSDHKLQPPRKKRKFKPAYEMFDPLAAKKADQAHLSATQSYYVNQHFAAYVERAMIKSQILEQFPVPTHERLVVPKVGPGQGTLS